MRPKGEVHQALMAAARELATAERGATLREMALHARVGLRAARYTVSYLRVSGALTIARTRRVPYRNRPVAEYVVTDVALLAQPTVSGVTTLLAAWNMKTVARG